MPGPSSPPLPFLALGDSYTIGEGVPAGGRWTHQLAAALRTRQVPLDDPRTIATTGWTTDELLAAIEMADPPSTHALVTLLIGVNNQYRGYPLDGYAAEFDRLLQRAIACAGGRSGRVLALSIPDWGVTPFGQASGRAGDAIAGQIDAFNHAAQASCSARDVAWVDITPLSRALGSRPDMLVGDGLHPSAAQYTRWMRMTLPQAARMLAGAAC